MVYILFSFSTSGDYLQWIRTFLKRYNLHFVNCVTDASAKRLLCSYLIGSTTQSSNRFFRNESFCLKIDIYSSEEKMKMSYLS